MNMKLYQTPLATQVKGFGHGGGRDSLGVPDWQQVLLNELQDGVQPHPETEGLSWNVLLEECRPACCHASLQRLQ